MTPRLLSARKAAEYLGVKPHRIYTLARNGELPQIKFSDNGHAYYSTFDLDALLERKRTGDSR